MRTCRTEEMIGFSLGLSLIPKILAMINQSLYRTCTTVYYISTPYKISYQYGIFLAEEVFPLT